jgi:hypothetical protein
MVVVHYLDLMHQPLGLWECLFKIRTWFCTKHWITIDFTFTYKPLRSTGKKLTEFWHWRNLLSSIAPRIVNVKLSFRRKAGVSKSLKICGAVCVTGNIRSHFWTPFETVSISLLEIISPQARLFGEQIQRVQNLVACPLSKINFVLKLQRSV